MDHQKVNIDVLLYNPQDKQQNQAYSWHNQ